MSDMVRGPSLSPGCAGVDGSGAAGGWDPGRGVCGPGVEWDAATSQAGVGPATPWRGSLGTAPEPLLSAVPDPVPGA
ncbi:hypothetical protein PBV88_19255, partial [Streptomyces sp. T21Q-yed]|nr:hypothetical protein [Streptomyces sp. T21Q-yed]